VDGFRDRLRRTTGRSYSDPPEPAEDDATPLLERLVGETLASVIFVRDYAQFDFDGPRLSTFVWPLVTVAGHQKRTGDPGYRDALVSLIGRDVTGAQDTPATGLVVFLGDAALTVKPGAGDLQGPEVAMLQMNDDSGAWDVWRPGEGSFVEWGARG
jgi:hypothetical protein